MDEKLLYLRKYSKTIEIIKYSQLSEKEKKLLPDYWNKAFANNNEKGTIDIILTEWEKYNYQFQSTIDYLKNNLVKVEFAKNNNELLLLYSIKNRIGKEIYYVGKNSKTLNIPNHLNKLWIKLPNTIKDIYKNLHNGWYYFASGSNGLHIRINVKKK